MEAGHSAKPDAAHGLGCMDGGWTQHDLIVATFNAVCGLAERLTGERMVVSVTCEDGRTMRLQGDGVEWVKAL